MVIDAKTKCTLDEIIRQVLSNNEAVVVTDDQGTPLVRIAPVPRPDHYYKGKPVYRPEDLQHLGRFF